MIVVLRTDAGAVIHVKSWTDSLPPDLRGRVGLVTVGEKSYSGHEIEAFTSLPVIGHLPDDREVARAVSGEPAAHRRLRRSPLTVAATRLAAFLSTEADCQCGDLRSRTNGDGDSSAEVSTDVEIPSVADQGSRLRLRFGGRLERPKILDRVHLQHQVEPDGQRLDPDPTLRTDPVLRTFR